MPLDPSDAPCFALTAHDVRPEDRRTHALLELVLAEVRSLRTALGERERIPRSRLSRLDRARAAPVLPEISFAIGDAVFRVAELLQHAQERDAALLAAIATACGGIDGGTTKRLGRLLARAADAAEWIDGYRVEVVNDEDRDGLEWRVVAQG
jgi:hypothetical protein